MAIALSTLQPLLAPLQGLWNWLVTPIEGQAAAPAALARSGARVPPRASRTAAPRAPITVARVVRPLRVVRVLDAQQGRADPGRMVISGRLADVCAELDRLAAQESRSLV